MRASTIGAGILLGGVVAVLSGAPAAFADPGGGYPAEPPEVRLTAEDPPHAGAYLDDVLDAVVRCPGEAGRPQSPVPHQMGAWEEINGPVTIHTVMAPATVAGGTVPGGYPLTVTWGGAVHDTGFPGYEAGSATASSSVSGADTDPGADRAEHRVGLVVGGLALGGVIGTGVGALAVRRKAQR